MSFPSVTINTLNGGSGRPLPGFDYYSGLMFYGTAPSVTGKWDTYTGSPNIKAQQLFSAADATSAGILPNTENTAAVAIYEILTAATAAGETIVFSVDVPQQNGAVDTVSIGTYTTVSGDTVIDTLGANLVIFINAGTVTHGFSATYSSADNELSITARKKDGVSLNTGSPLDIDVSDTDITGTITQFAGGTASQYAIWFYQISEYFRIFGTGGTLWVGIISATSSRNEIVTLQNQAALGKLRQIGIYDTSTTTGLAANITASLLTVQNAVDTLEQTAPCVVVYAPNVKPVADITTYPDQNLNTAGNCQCVISQDGLADGALLFVQSGQSVGNIGAKLASIAKSRVSASDAQPIDTFNMSNGIENNTPAFANGQLSSAVSNGGQIQLQNYNYTFFRTWGDVKVGTYWNDNRTCIVNSDDFAYVNDNRTIQKVQRICRQTYVPLLSSEIIFNADGTLTDAAVAYFEGAGLDAITAGMITGYGSLPLISGVSVEIDPTQDVVETNNLIVFVTIVRNGIARNITVNVGFGTL